MSETNFHSFGKSQVVWAREWEKKKETKAQWTDIEKGLVTPLFLVAVKQTAGKMRHFLSSFYFFPKTNALLGISLLIPNPSESIVGSIK